MIQLNPPIPMETPLGYGLARIYHSVEDFNDQWVVFLDCGVVWTFDNADVRAAENLTLGRQKHSFKETWNGFEDIVSFMRRYKAAK